MPILRLNVGEDGLSLNGSPASAMSGIRSAARGSGPVIVMIHGFKYDPNCGSCSPHSTIFARTAHPDRTDDTQWPRHLGFGNGHADEGLAIAFGWRARGNLWRAERSARAAGRNLARVVREIRNIAPERPVHMVTHSLGSEVAFAALERLPTRSVGRIFALTAASYVSRANAAMQTPAGRTSELFNVTSRENDVFDFMYERMIAPPERGDWAMGTGVELPNAVNIQIDCPETLRRLTDFGGHIEPSNRRVCHWSGYTRPGVLRFYKLAMRQPDRVPLDALRRALPAQTAPRWSRVIQRPRITLPLPHLQKAAS
ncbi:MAG: alpha/beta hydrolase [Pseudomonadota bacterium]